MENEDKSDTCSSSEDQKSGNGMRVDDETSKQLHMEKEFYEFAFFTISNALNSLAIYRENPTENPKEVTVKLPEVPHIADKQKRKVIKGAKVKVDDGVKMINNVIKEMNQIENDNKETAVEKEYVIVPSVQKAVDTTAETSDILKPGDLEKKIITVQKQKEDLKRKLKTNFEMLETVKCWLETLSDKSSEENVSSSEIMLDMRSDIDFYWTSKDYMLSMRQKIKDVHLSHHQLYERLNSECKRLQEKIKKNERHVSQPTHSKEQTDKDEQIDINDKYKQCVKKFSCLAGWVDSLNDRLTDNSKEEIEFSIPEDIIKQKRLKIKQKQIERIDRALWSYDEMKLQTPGKAIKKIERLERQLTLTLDEKDRAVVEKDKTLSRLSEIAGAKLKDNNPAIADLSDENRPTKLAEKMSELYDNEWTDAFSYQTTTVHRSEKEAIERLLGIFQVVYKTCCKMARKQLTSFICPVPEGSPDFDLEEVDAENIPKEMLSKAKELQRLLADNVSNSIKQRIMNVEPFKDTFKEETEHCRGYIDRCINICWMMSVQDPPVVLVFENANKEEIDSKLFKHYTKSGKAVDYVVWPVMLLHKDGPLLQKGVIQPV